MGEVNTFEEILGSMLGFYVTLNITAIYGGWMGARNTRCSVVKMTTRDVTNKNESPTCIQGKDCATIGISGARWDVVVCRR
jgi:hypothetical protein